MTTLDSVIRRTDDTAWRVIESEALVVDSRNSLIYPLNPAATRIWELLESPLYQRVQSFTELAVALNSLSSTHVLKDGSSPLRGLKLSSELSHFFRESNTTDDMRQFLGAALEYLGALSEGMIEVPVTIIRSLKEVEKIAKIEEQALPPEKQQLLRFYMIQIARLAGENG